MKQFFRDMLATLWLLVWLAIGIFITAQVLRWLNGMQGTGLEQAPLFEVLSLESIIAAVQIVGVLFASTFGLRFLDRLLFRGAVISRLGLKPGSPALLPLLAFSLVHGDDNHLFSNTRFVLIFAAVAALLAPSVTAFLVVVLVILVIAGFGIVRFGRKDSNHVGASGIMLGFYSFNLLYGLFATGVGGTITAVLLLLFFGRPMWRTLRSDHPRVSREAHLWGFIGGIISATALVRLGMY